MPQHLVKKIKETWDSSTLPLRCPRVTAWQAGWRGFQTFANFFERRLQGGQVHVIFQVSEVWKRVEANDPVLENGCWVTLQSKSESTGSFPSVSMILVGGLWFVFLFGQNLQQTTTKLQIQLVPNTPTQPPSCKSLKAPRAKSVIQTPTPRKGASPFILYKHPSFPQGSSNHPFTVSRGKIPQEKSSFHTSFLGLCLQAFHWEGVRARSSGKK